MISRTLLISLLLLIGAAPTTQPVSAPSRLAVGSTTGIVLLDAQSGDVLRELEAENTAAGLMQPASPGLSGDGNTLVYVAATDGERGPIVRLDLADRQRETLTGSGEAGSFPDVSADGSTVVWTGDNGPVFLRDGKRIPLERAFGPDAYAMLAGDGSSAVVIAAHGESLPKAFKVDLITGEATDLKVTEAAGVENLVPGLVPLQAALSGDARTLAFAANLEQADPTAPLKMGLFLLDLQTGEVRRVGEESADVVVGVAISDDGSRVAAALQDNSGIGFMTRIITANVAQPDEVRTVIRHDSRADAQAAVLPALSRNGQSLYYVEGDLKTTAGRIMRTNLQSGERHVVFEDSRRVPIIPLPTLELEIGG